MSSDLLEKKLKILEESYFALLQDTLSQLQAYSSLKNSQAREQHVQQIQTRIEFGLEETAELHAEITQKLGQVTPALSAVKQYPERWRYAVPTLDACYQASEHAFQNLMHHLLTKPAGQVFQPVCIHGSDGVGKSALAAALAQDETVQQRFKDGIFWVRLGLMPDVCLLQSRLFAALGQAVPGFVDAGVGLEFLSRLFESRDCLLILDDVRDIELANAFNVNSEQTQLLLTTADAEVSAFVQHIWSRAEVYELTGPTAEEMSAIGLCLSQQPPDAEALQACAAHPAILRLLSGLVAEGESWSGAVQTLRACEPSVAPEAYSRELYCALQTQLDALGEDADCYFALGVFYEYASLPEKVVALLWQYMFKKSEKDVETLLQRFVNYGLLSASGQSPQRIFSLQSYQYEFLSEFNEEEEARKLHGYLLSAYLRLCQQGWVSGPDDGYFFDHLCLHLYSAGRRQELKSLLLDLDWLRRKIKHSGVLSLISDMGLLDEDEELLSIQQVLISSASALAQDKKQLATELLDNLWENPLPGVQTLLNQAKELEPSWEPEFPDAEL